MMNRIFALSICCTIAIFESGCASTPASHFYTLSSVTAPAAASSTLSVVVGPVSVPSLVDRPQIVVSTGQNQLQLDEFNRWASPLQDNIARVVAEDLVAMLGTPHVTIYPQTLGAEADYRATIEVQNFESAPGKSAALNAVWSVRRMKDGKTETGRTIVREELKESGYEALAASHSRALERLSQDIAAALRLLAGSGQ